MTWKTPVLEEVQEFGLQVLGFHVPLSSSRRYPVWESQLHEIAHWAVTPQCFWQTAIENGEIADIPYPSKLLFSTPPFDNAPYGGVMTLLHSDYDPQSIIPGEWASIEWANQICKLKNWEPPAKQQAYGSGPNPEQIRIAGINIEKGDLVCKTEYEIRIGNQLIQLVASNGDSEWRKEFQLEHQCLVAPPSEVIKLRSNPTQD